MSLTTEQIDRYRTHGWVAPIDVMSETEASALNEQLLTAERDYPTELHAEHRNNAHLAFPFLGAVTTDPRIVSAAASLVGPDISLWSTVLFIKEPDSSAFVSWHQDAFYMGLDTTNFVTAWLALTPSTVQTGCVSVVPGSHHELRRHQDTFGDDNILTRGQQVAVDNDDVVHLELAPGQMSLHHPWLIHGSQPNRGTTRRVGFALQSYLGGDVRALRGEHHVLPIQGAAPHESLTPVPLPNAICSPDALEARRRANAALASVLYDGAEETRKL